MARDRYQADSPGAEHGTSFAHLLDDVQSFITTYLREINQLRRIAPNRHVFDKLGNQGAQVTAYGAEVGELRYVSYSGLQRVFDHPQYIVLEYLDYVVRQLRLLATGELHLILSTEFPELDTPNIIDRIYAFANGLTHRLSLAQNEWADLPSSHPTPLCHTAKQLNNGYESGTTEYIDSSSLSSSERTYLRQNGGSFNYWQCRSCKYEKKFYQKHLHEPFENGKESIKDPTGKMNYKIVLLAKSHVHGHSYACLICLCQGHGFVRYRNSNELTAHMRHHNIHDLPPLFMRQLFFTTRTAWDGRSRYDLKFWRAGERERR